MNRAEQPPPAKFDQRALARTVRQRGVAGLVLISRLRNWNTAQSGAELLAGAMRVSHSL